MIKIKLDKERNLRLCMKGILAFQEETGHNILKGFQFNPSDMKTLSALLWSCLIHEDKDLKLDDVLVMLDLSNMVEAFEAVQKCMTESLPTGEPSPLVEKPQVS